MPKFKKGDRVRCTNKNSVRYGRYFVVLNDACTSPYLRDIESQEFACTYEDNLELVGLTWDTLMEGDVVVSSGGDERKVLGICGRIIFLSKYDDHDASDGYLTKEQLIGYGYTIKNVTEDVKEMTVAEVSKLVGKTVKIVEEK